ncbi:hypothetical protein BJX68DRAFT_261088 [Aspergillus pseudodeflectus]|uniref:Uncharacterized protein n=1 Tax=Aspergillus pseudodeflectus TaxID=176178 RepID=A0ABR4L6Y6_9EURO
MFLNLPQPFPCLVGIPPGEDYDAILDAADCWSVKCSCTLNDDHDELQTVFGRSHLRIVETDLSQASLTKLTQLSSNSRIAALVQGLLIHRGEDAALGRGFNWSRNSLGKITPPAVLISQLAAVVQSLTNCVHFGVSRAPNPIFTAVDKTQPSPSEAVTILNTVIALTKREVKTYGIDFRLYSHTPSMKANPIDQVSLESIHIGDPAFLHSLQSLETLTLQFPIESEASTSSFALALIQSAPSIQNLAIDFDEGTSAGPFLSTLLSTGPTMQLETLTLTKGTLSGRDVLTLFIYNCVNLRSLHLEQIRLEENGSWLRIMDLLRNGFPCLEEAKLLELMSGNDAIDWWSLELAGVGKEDVGGKSRRRRFVWDRVEEMPY